MSTKNQLLIISAITIIEYGKMVAQLITSSLNSSCFTAVAQQVKTYSDKVSIIKSPQNNSLVLLRAQDKKIDSIDPPAPLVSKIRVITISIKN